MSAVILLVFLSAAFWFSLFAVVAAVVAVALWEYELLSKKWRWPAAWYLLYPLGFLPLFAGSFPNSIAAVRAGLVIAIAGLLILVAADRSQALGRWGVSVGGALYVGFCLSFALILVTINGPVSHFGTSVLITALAAVFVGDSAAYLIGTKFGRHRLAPKVSPKKSVEGAIADLVASAITAFLVGAWFGLWPQMPWFGLLSGLAISVVAQAGDLLESKLKRLAGVKDSSSLIPGHGGMLDRIDSLIFVMPLTVAIGALASALPR
jgi:phosphatidate cytidylyltransferase